MRPFVHFVWNRLAHPDPRVQVLPRWIGRLKAPEETGVSPERILWIDTRAVFRFGATLLLACLLGPGGVYLWLRANPHNLITYADLGWPWRWSRLRDLRGQSYLAEGLHALSEQRFDEGITLIQHGLSRHPDDAGARLAVAKIFARYGLHREVGEIMLPQLTLSRPSREFFRFLISAAAQNDDHAMMLTVCGQALTGLSATSPERVWYLEQQAAALIALGRPAEALVALDAAGPRPSLEGRVLRIKALDNADRSAEAVADIRNWPPGIAVEFRLQLLVLACGHAGRFDEMDRAIAELKRLHPTEPEPWLGAIRDHADVGRTDAALSDAKDALRRFNADRAVVTRLELACAETDLPELMNPCIENARDFGRPIAPLLFNLALAQVLHGHTAEAEHTAERMFLENLRADKNVSDFSATAVAEPRAGSVLAPMREMTNWLQTLLEAVSAADADPAFGHCTVLLGQDYPLRAFADSAKALARSKHWTAVAAVSRAGLMRYPGSTQMTQWAAIAAREISSQSQLAETARAPEEDPAVFFAKVDAAITRGAWPEAEALLQEILAAAPSWLPDARGDLAWRAVRCALEQDDDLRGVALISMRLNLNRAEAPRALELAREWHRRGKRETARALAECIVKTVPEFKAGDDFLRELTPVPPQPAH